MTGYWDEKVRQRFLELALRLSAEIGVKKVAEQLGIVYGILSTFPIDLMKGITTNIIIEQ